MLKNNRIALWKKANATRTFRQSAQEDHGRSAIPADSGQEMLDRSGQAGMVLDVEINPLCSPQRAANHFCTSAEFQPLAITEFEDKVDRSLRIAKNSGSGLTTRR